MAATGGMRLPPTRTRPLPREGEEFSRLTRRERALAAEVLGESPVFVLARTRTRVDVGSWGPAARVCMAVGADEIVLFAAGRRPYVERIGFGQLGESTYNHVTGQLVPSPAEGLRLGGLKVPPLTGYQVLAQIRRQE